jgi:hypothetical protein
MSCCYINLGDVPHDGAVSVGQSATQTGAYKYLVNYQGGVLSLIQAALPGDDLVVPLPARGQWNEDYTYTFKIIAPDGSSIVEDGCGQYQFQTKINFTCHDNRCDSTDVNPDYPYSGDGGS